MSDVKSMEYFISIPHLRNVCVLLDDPIFPLMCFLAALNFLSRGDATRGKCVPSRKEDDDIHRILSGVVLLIPIFEVIMKKNLVQMISSLHARL